MIPRPPPDPRLPGLIAALDGDAMGKIVERAFRDVTVCGCTPHHVKYKPGRYARVQYRLDIRDPRGKPVRVPAHVAVYQPARAHKLAARHGLADRTGPTALSSATYVDHVHGIVQIFPVDLGLPGLQQAADPDAVGRLVMRNVSGEPGVDLRGCEAELVRYKAGKRAVLKYRLGATATPVVYGKLRKDGAERVVTSGTELRRAGVPVAEPVGWLPEIGMAVQAEAPGVRLADLRHTDEYAGWMPAVADTLAQLHNATVSGLPTWSPDQESHELHDSAATLAALLPHVGERAASAARRIAALLTTVDGEVATTHGSFHDDQVLVDGQGITLIDTDSAMQGNPLSDVGHFLSYLAADHADDAHQRFLDRYFSASRPGARTSRAREYLIFEAASALRWASMPFRELRPDWPAKVEERVLRSEQLIPNSTS